MTVQTGLPNRPSFKNKKMTKHIRNTFGLLSTYNVESSGNYTIWYGQYEALTLQSAVAHLKVKCGENADISFSSTPRALLHLHRRLSQSLFRSHLHYGWFI